MSAAPKRKVLAATGGTGVGVVVAAFIVGILDDHVYDPAVTGSVPDYVTGLVMVLVPIVLSFAAGYLQPSERAPEHRDEDGQVALDVAGAWLFVVGVSLACWIVLGWGVARAFHHL